MIKQEPYAFEIKDRKEVDEKMNKMIRSTVKLAYEHSPFWKRKFDALNIKPSNITDQDSLLKANKKGLTVSDQELINELNYLATDFVGDSYIEELWTSGTRGRPKRMLYGPYDIKRSNEQIQLAYNAMGLSTGDYVLNLFSPYPYASGPLSLACARYMKLHSLKISSPISTDGLLQTIKIGNPKSLFIAANRARQVAQESESFGEKLNNLGIETVFTGGETCTKEKQDKISDEWGADTFDTWASTELSAFGYQTKDCNQNTMHIAENRVFLNIVDPATLDPVSKEERGVDLVSTLYDVGEKPAMILLGYSHGDSSKVIDSIRCNCGRTYKQVAWPIDRSDEVVKMAMHNIFPVSGTESAIVGSPFLTGEFCCKYVEPKELMRRQSLEIRVETKMNIPEDEKCKLTDKILKYVISDPATHEIIMSQAIFSIEFVDKGRIYFGWEDYLRPKRAKPLRLIKV